LAVIGSIVKVVIPLQSLLLAISDSGIGDHVSFCLCASFSISLEKSAMIPFSNSID
jgi:hypothetical protein